MLARLFTLSSIYLLIFVLSRHGVSGISLPACQVLPPRQRAISGVRSSTLDIVQLPFGIVYAANSNSRAFVAAEQDLLVLDTTRRPPCLLYTLPLNSEAFLGEQGAAGVALSHDGHHLLIAGGYGALVIDTAKALRGDTSGFVVAMLQSPPDKPPAGSTANQVTISRDDKYIFVSQEYGSSATFGRGVVEVFKLHRPTVPRAKVTADYIGDIALGGAVVGVALSSDGRFLYATSEVGIDTGQEGMLSVLDMVALRTNPKSALLHSVNAGCNPVQVKVAPDGKTVWVAARASNHIIAFDAAKLAVNSSTALVASVQVGVLPVDIAFLRGQSRILVVNSNRYNVPNATSSLSLVDFEAALSGRSNTLGQFQTGLDPRAVAVSSDGRSILVTNHGTANQTRSSSIQMIDVASLP